jgi:hypothetical protein
MEEFVRRHFAPEALASRPLPERLRRTAEKWDQVGTLTMDSVPEETTTPESPLSPAAM